MIHLGTVYARSFGKEAGGRGLGGKPSRAPGKWSAALAGGPGPGAQGGGAGAALGSSQRGSFASRPREERHGHSPAGEQTRHLCSGQRARLWWEEKVGGGTAGAEGALGVCGLRLRGRDRCGGRAGRLGGRVCRCTRVGPGGRGLKGPRSGLHRTPSELPGGAQQG